MKIYKSLLLIIAFLLLSGNTSFAAADCAVFGTPSEELRRATAVFSGKVVGKELRKITDASSEDFGGERLFVKLKVNKWWKGGGDDEMVLRTSIVYFPNSTSREFAEDFRFSSDESYLVYAFYYNGAFGTSGCTRTKKFSDAAEDLKELGEGSPLKTKQNCPNQDFNGKQNLLLSRNKITIAVLRIERLISKV